MCFIYVAASVLQAASKSSFALFWSERARCPVHRPSNCAFAAHIAALTTAAPFTNRLLQYITHYMSSLARSGTVDRGRAQRARYLGEDDPSDVDDDDSSDARVTMGQEPPEPPEPPLLELDACGLVVKFTPPSGATLANILLHAEGGVVRYYCPKTKSFVAKSFGAAPLGYYVLKSSEVGQQQQVVAQDGLMEGKVSATIYYRSTSMGGWPDSPHSNTLELARPAKPCAPCVSPAAAVSRDIVTRVRKDQVVVSYALPALSFKGSVKVEGGGTINYVQQLHKNPTITEAHLVTSFADFFSSVPKKGSRPVQLPPHLQGPNGDWMIRGQEKRLRFGLPATDVEYRISVAAFNGVGWSDFSEATKVRLSNHVPMAPCAPTLTEIGEDSVRVHFTRPPYNSSITSGCINILMNVVPGGPKLYYSTTDSTTDAFSEDAWYANAYSTGRLVSAADYDTGTCGMPWWKTCCVVTGLAPNTEYEVKALGVNGYGASPVSAPTRFKTLPSDVEITGVQTADKRDEEAKKHAVDVDAADEPVAKRAKSES